MTYIELVNRFWQVDEGQSFSGNETRLYFYLLKVANSLSWPFEFDYADNKLTGNLGFSANTLKSSRDRLLLIGLLDYEVGGSGRGNKTRYQLRYQKLTPISVEELDKRYQERCQNKYQKLIPNDEKRYQENPQILTPNDEKVSEKVSKTDTKSSIIENKTFRETNSKNAGAENQPQNLPVEKPPSPPTPAPPKREINIPFETWWEAYDKRIDKKACEPKWNRLTDEQRQAALTHTGRYVLETPNPKYRKNPETYLNRESWHNEPLRYEPEPQRPGSSRNNSHSESGHEQVADLFDAIDQYVNSKQGG